MIQGLNITVKIQRRVEGVDDDIGGATFTLTDITTKVRARISNLRPTDEQRIAGIEVSRMFNMHIWPANVDIIDTDIVVPESGPHKDKTFLVRGVQQSSLFDGDPKSFLSVRLQRDESARSLQ